jgi:hypothetical protein
MLTNMYVREIVRTPGTCINLSDMYYFAIISRTYIRYPWGVFSFLMATNTEDYCRAS